MQNRNEVHEVLRNQVLGEPQKTNNYVFGNGVCLPINQQVIVIDDDSHKSTTYTACYIQGIGMIEIPVYDYDKYYGKKTTQGQRNELFRSLRNELKSACTTDKRDPAYTGGITLFSYQRPWLAFNPVNLASYNPTPNDDPSNQGGGFNPFSR